MPIIILPNANFYVWPSPDQYNESSNQKMPIDLLDSFSHISHVSSVNQALLQVWRKYDGAYTLGIADEF
jgi:hypothetical protein